MFFSNAITDFVTALCRNFLDKSKWHGIKIQFSDGSSVWSSSTVAPVCSCEVVGFDPSIEFRVF